MAGCFSRIPVVPNIDSSVLSNPLLNHFEAGLPFGPKVSYLHIPDSKVAKNDQSLDVRTGPEDGANNKVIDRLAEADIHECQVMILLVGSEYTLESLHRNVSAAVDVYML